MSNSAKSPLGNPLSVSTPVKSSPLAAQTVRTAARASQQDPGGTLSSALRVRPIPGRFNLQQTASQRDVDLYRLVIRNPANAEIVLRKSGSQQFKISVLNARGRVLTFAGRRLERTIGAGVVRFNLGGVSPSTYFVRVATQASTAVSYRLRINTSNVPTS